MNFTDFLNDATLIEQARQAAKAEAEVYRKQQEEELRKLAFEQLKAKFLAEEKAKIDKEVEQARKELSLPSEPAPVQPVEETPAVEQPTISFPRTGLAAHNKMKDFFDSSADDEVKDRVRYLPSDEALEIIANFDGLSEEEINNLGFIERQEQPNWNDLI